jgi:tRNA threonylcarbamoyladenosine biosynthesis protein TsaB
VRILGFDTATRATAVAVLDTDSGRRVEARDDPAPEERPHHTTRLLGLIAQVLERAELDWPDLDRLAVGTGPGTFTGLRIGVATARALAGARGLPLVGVSTLRSLALGAAPEAERRGVSCLMPVLDARRQEVFAAAWGRELVVGWATSRKGGNPAQTELLEPQAIKPDTLATLSGSLAPARLAVGEGAVEFRSVLEVSGTDIPPDDSGLHRVNAVHHCRLAVREPGDQPDVRPEYLRRPDAELALEAASDR